MGDRVNELRKKSLVEAIEGEGSYLFGTEVVVAFAFVCELLLDRGILGDEVHGLEHVPARHTGFHEHSLDGVAVAEVLHRLWRVLFFEICFLHNWPP